MTKKHINTSYIKRAAANKIRVVFSDVDGVFTDNRVLEGAPYKAKWRSYYDGQGVSLLRALGLQVVLITNEKGASAQHIVDVCKKWNELPSSSKIEGDGGWSHVVLYTGAGDSHKVEAAKDFLKTTSYTWEQCAFMGDDLVDVPLFKHVSLKAAPISADPAIKAMADFVSERPGGAGAFRDFANALIMARNIDPLSLPPQ
jgi:3-deoxy-D-manno-octulosonate 8-phosphate phosphatase (KDO 8-P phosphatase)